MSEAVFDYLHEFLHYVQNGGFLDAGYWLHPSVREFVYLCGIYRTKDRLYRVDWVGNSHRLSIWKSNEYMVDKPEMILYNGQETDNYILFNNDSYSYIVPLYRKGEGG